MIPKTGLYVHIPFCRKKCFYCSFIVAIYQKSHIDNYAACLEKEMCLWKGHEISSVYFGGGTPSQLSSKSFSRLMKAIKNIFFIKNFSEITVEMNPEDVSLEKLLCYRDVGVNRLSLGVQTFNDSYLKFLGRSHDSARACAAYDLVRHQGFDNVSVDLMYGFSGQGLDEIDEDLETVRSLEVDHVSLYSLTIEPGSKFFVHNISLPGQEEMSRQYQHVRERLLAQGFDHYEVSNFARQGKRSVHNIHYWQGGNYIGLGIGAHSHVDGKRWWNVPRVREYIERINNGRGAEEGNEMLTTQQRLTESLVFGLRMMDGVNVNDIEKRLGDFLPGQKKVIENLINDGFLVRHDGRIKCTEKGVLVLDTISEKLI